MIDKKEAKSIAAKYTADIPDEYKATVYMLANHNVKAAKMGMIMGIAVTGDPKLTYKIISAALAITLATLQETEKECSN
jgi:hypothetical protein